MIINKLLSFIRKKKNKLQPDPSDKIREYLARQLSSLGDIFFGKIPYVKGFICPQGSMQCNCFLDVPIHGYLVLLLKTKDNKDILVFTLQEPNPKIIQKLINHNISEYSEYEEALEAGYPMFILEHNKIEVEVYSLQHKKTKTKQLSPNVTIYEVTIYDLIICFNEKILKVFVVEY